MTSYLAAWVPDDDPQRPWDEAEALAVRWVREQAARQRSAPLVVTYSRQNASCMEHARGIEQVTVRSPGSVTGPVGRPVLAYAPDEETLALAHRHARGSALVMVEGGTSLMGWARATRAVDLVTGRTAPGYDDRQQHLLDRVTMLKNNGWGDSHARSTLPRLLPAVLRHVPVDELVGYVLAQGASAPGAKRVRLAAQSLA